MKKLFAIIMAVALMLTLSVSVCAAPGQFVQSPSTNSAPTLISVEKDNEDCTADLIITPYSERYLLPAELKALIEAHGGKNQSAVASNTTYLLAGEKIGPSKLQKATKLGVKIIVDAVINHFGTDDDHVGVYDNTSTDSCRR